MLTSNRYRLGFTIVELLIVIVVIAILATISIIAYTGIQNRANDTAVQSDLRNYANKIMEYQALNDQYPKGHITLGGGSSYGAVQGIEAYSFAKSSYATDGHNIYYCERNGGFAIGAKSKSGNVYRYRSSGGLELHSGAWGNADTTCPAILGTGGVGSASGATVSYAFNSTDGTWSAMAK